jgi:hypothetical protein
MSKTVQKFLIHNPDKPKVKSVSVNFLSYENSGTRFNPGPDEKPKSKILYPLKLFKVN